MCLCVTDDSNVTRDKREESALVCYKVLTLNILLFIATLDIVLFKSRLGLFINVYCTLRQPLKENYR